MGTLTVSPHVLTDQFDFNADPWSALKKNNPDSGHEHYDLMIF